MKLIRCPSCGANRIGPRSELHPDGGPVLMGRFIGGSDFPVVFKCHRCTGAFKLSAVDFNGLPGLSAREQAQLAPSVRHAVD